MDIPPPLGFESGPSDCFGGVPPLGFEENPVHLGFEFQPTQAAAQAFRTVMIEKESELIHPSKLNYGQFSTDGAVHDTFKIDRYDNLYDGHTSVYLPGGKHIALSWCKEPEE